MYFTARTYGVILLLSVAMAVGASVEPIEFAARPMLLGGTVLVPARELVGVLAAKASIAWDSETQTATINYEGSSMRFTSGRTSAMWDGKQETIAQPPILKGGTLFVPVRPLAALLGAQVGYQNSAEPQIVLSRGDSAWSFPCPHAARANITITKVPPRGAGSNSWGHISGRVMGVDPGSYRVVVYAGTDHWYVQPWRNAPFTKIKSDGRWRTGTHLGWEYAALLVRKGYQPETDVYGDLPGVGGEIVAVTYTKP